MFVAVILIHMICGCYSDPKTQETNVELENNQIVVITSTDTFANQYKIEVDNILEDDVISTTRIRIASIRNRVELFNQRCNLDSVLLDLYHAELDSLFLIEGSKDLRVIEHQYTFIRANSAYFDVIFKVAGNYFNVSYALKYVGPTVGEHWRFSNTIGSGNYTEDILKRKFSELDVDRFQIRDTIVEIVLPLFEGIRKFDLLRYDVNRQETRINRYASMEAGSQPSGHWKLESLLEINQNRPLTSTKFESDVLILVPYGRDVTGIPSIADLSFTWSVIVDDSDGKVVKTRLDLMKLYDLLLRLEN